MLLDFAASKLHRSGIKLRVAEVIHAILPSPDFPPTLPTLPVSLAYLSNSRLMYSWFRLSVSRAEGQLPGGKIFLQQIVRQFYLLLPPEERALLVG